MQELIAALTRAANAVAVYYEGAAVPAQTRMSSEGPVIEKKLSEDFPAKTKKEKPAKEKTAKEVVAETTELKAKAPTKEEFKKENNDVAKLLIGKYNKPVPPGNKPEGFYLAKHVIVEEFKVGMLEHLTYPEHAGFSARIKELLADDKAARALLDEVLKQHAAAASAAGEA